MTGSRRTFLRRTALLGGSVLTAGCLGSGPEPEEQIRSSMEASEAFRDVSVALKDGYRAAAAHVQVEDRGLSEVFFDQEQPHELGPDDLDSERPQLLYYRLTADGRYEPAAVGWSVGAEKVSEPPTLFDKSFTDETSGHVPVLPEHYALNAWVFDDHLDDLFAPFHPDLTGPSFVDNLDTARSTLSPFYDSDAAEDDGYENTEQHVFGDAGPYGVQFIDSERTGTDLERPPILLYRMTDQWYYELLGVEWYVPADEVDEPPSLFGQAFHKPMRGHSPEADQSEHFGLHAWLFRANPAGMFVPFNPRFG